MERLVDRGWNFGELIFDPHLHSIAQLGMGWNGSRLLHDHIICKPHKGSNKNTLASGFDVLASGTPMGVQLGLR